MNNIIIDNNSKNIITNILSQNITPEIEVYAFGSRTKGTTKKYADLDLALKAPHIIEQKIIDNLNIGFENSLIPFKVDIIDLNNIDEDFYNAILESLVLFYPET